MNRTELFIMSRNRGIGLTNEDGSPTPYPQGALQALRSDLIKYFMQTDEGKEAFGSRPVITGDGVEEYKTVEAVVDALLLEVR